MTALDPNHNVVLTGFMGTGKSTVGRILARITGRRFVDTDHVIEDQHGPIPEIFAGQGEEGFRALEREVAADLASQTGHVISTGGGLLVDERNADALGATGRIFCLVATPDEILRRVLSPRAKERPLLAVPDPHAKIVELLAQRADAYASFEQVDTTSRAPGDIAADIASRL